MNLFHKILLFQFAYWRNQRYERFIKKRYKYNMSPHNSTQLSQMMMMMSECRATCKHHLSKLDGSQIPEEVYIAGGYSDIVTDTFGVEYNLCNLSMGKTYKGNERFLSRSVFSRRQEKMVPQLTEKGFEKQRIPNDLYATILTNRKKMLKNGQKWQLENCSEGIQNGIRIYESKKAQECHWVASEVTFEL